MEFVLVRKKHHVFGQVGVSCVLYDPTPEKEGPGKRQAAEGIPGESEERRYERGDPGSTVGCDPRVPRFFVFVGDPDTPVSKNKNTFQTEPLDIKARFSDHDLIFIFSSICRCLRG